MSKPALLLVAQDVPNFPRQRLPRVGLAEQINAFVKPAAMDDRILGIARGKQNRDVGDAFPGPSGKLGTAQRPGHNYIREQEVDRHAALDDRERALGVFSLEHPIAEFGEHIDNGLPDVLVVLGNQHSLGAAPGGTGLNVCLDVLFCARSGKIEPHGGAMGWLAVDLDMPS